MLLRGHRGVVMGRIRKTASKADPAEVDPKIQEERQRIAERLVRELRKAGYVCSLGHDSLVPTLRRDN
jgi:hypothetical protein